MNFQKIQIFIFILKCRVGWVGVGWVGVGWIGQVNIGEMR